MKTIILKINHNEIQDEEIAHAGRILRDGGLVAFPTETVYGLGGNALNSEAAGKIYAAKGRPSDNPLIVHIADMVALPIIADEIPDVTMELARAFWPGPLTMIFKKKECVPYGTTGGLDTVAVRMPSHPAALAIIRAAGGYVAAPSANTSGRPSPTRAEHVIEDLNGKIEMIVDGGSVAIGVESTILDMTVNPPMILRPGAVTREMLESVLGEVSVDRTLLTEDSGEAPKAPGMKYRHYAPKAQLIILDGEISEVVKAIKQIAYEQARLGYSVGIICTKETEQRYTVGNVKSIGTRENEESVARNLYRILREFDDEEVQYIYSEPFTDQGIGTAVMNRLTKAAGHHRLPASYITKLQKYRKVLFISNGDNSRGPMAAVLLRIQPLLQEYVIESRGMVVLFPEPANQKAEAIMKSKQLSMEGYQATALDESDFTEDTLVLTMSVQQKQNLLKEYPDAHHVYTLAEYVSGREEDVVSAYGQPLSAYGALYEQLEELTVSLSRKLNEEAKKV